MDSENNKQTQDVTQPSADTAKTTQNAAKNAQTPEADVPAPQDHSNTLLGGPQKEADIPQKTGDGKSSGDGKNTDQNAQETYSFKLPEGFSFAGEQQDAYVSLAKEAKLTPEAAQKILDYGTEQIKAALKRQEESSTAVFDETVKEWGEKTKKRLGGEDGSALEKNLAKAKKAIDSFATDGFKRLLDSRSLGGFGLGNHPELVETFLNVAKAIETDTYVDRRKSGGAAALSAEEVLYPNQVPHK